MTAIAITAPATSQKMFQMMQGPKAEPGASIKVLAITPPSSYTSTGDALDLTRYTKRITALSAAGSTVITCGAAVADGTSVLIKGTNSVPNADGTYTATYVGSTSFSIPYTVTTAGWTGTATYGFFPHRIYWVMFMNPTVRSGTDYAQVGYAPGTAMTDGKGGYSPADGKIVFSTGATEFGGDASTYTVYAVVCGC